MPPNGLQPNIIREAPAVPPLTGGVPSASSPNVRQGNQNNLEPVLRVDNIQGNILNGFNKDHQAMLYLKITEPFAFKGWLAAQIPFVSTAAEVISFNRLCDNSPWLKPGASRLTRKR